MATNQEFEGNVRSVIVTYPTTPTSGCMCRFGSICGIALTAENAAGYTVVDFSRDRMWNLSVTASGGAIAKGDKLYFHDAGGITNVAAGGYLCGIAFAAIASGTATIAVKLEGPGEVGEGSLKVAKVALASGLQNAFAFAWQNPETSAIAVTRVLLDVTKAGGTASAVMDIGSAANATTHSDNLIDGVGINTTGLFDNLGDPGSSGKAKQRVDENGGTTDWVTGQILTANASALVGNVYIHYEVL